jgi:hypothetical protein
MFRVNFAVIGVLCLVACWLGKLDAGTLRKRDTKMIEKRLSDARDLHTNIMSTAIAFHDAARESLAYGLVAQSQAQGEPQAQSHEVVTAGGGRGGSGGSSSGSSSGTISAGVFVHVAVHANLDCAADVEMEAIFGTGVCVQVEASNGAKSMMYTYNSLLLTEVLYSDNACKTVLSTHPIGVVASLVDVCSGGVKVTVTSSFVPPTGSGTLIW